MYKLHLRSGKSITSAMLQHSLGLLPCEPGTMTHKSRMSYLGAIERLEARGMTYSNEDFDVLSAALNFLDAVQPEHGLRDDESAYDIWRNAGAAYALRCKERKLSIVPLGEEAYQYAASRGLPHQEIIRRAFIEGYREQA